MSQNFNITMKQYNGTDYDVLYPATIDEQVGLSDEIMSKFGSNISAQNLQAVLNYLGNYSMYWWRQIIPGTPSVEVTNTVGGALNVPASGGSNYDLQYSDSITINNQGIVSLVSPSNTIINYNTSSSAIENIISNKYWRSSSDSNTPISYGFYAYESYSSSGYSYKALRGYQLYINKNETITYVQSSNRNAYPDSGSQNGYSYMYMGTPLENSISAPKMMLTNYIGNGNSSSSNTTVVTIQTDFTPYLVIVSGNLEAGYYDGSGTSGPSSGIIGIAVKNDFTAYTGKNIGNAFFSFGDNYVSINIQEDTTINKLNEIYSVIILGM